MNKMKKKLFFAVLALVAMASCTSDEDVTVVSPPDPAPEAISDAIVFSTVSKGATRADHLGADAANMLSEKFIVGGFKGDGSAMITVFDNYIVKWEENTAATTESNTSDWEYVGITAEKPSSIAGNSQAIKYWDYSSAQYDFIAYSTGSMAPNAEPTNTPLGDKIRVSAIDWDALDTKAYTLGGSRENLAKCYIADLVSVYKDGTDPQYAYQQEVPLVFRSLATKVRVALYETIPGYSVKDVKFYTDDDTPISTGASETKATLFTSGNGTNNNFYTFATAWVYFPTTGKAEKQANNTDYNKAHVELHPVASTASTTQDFGGLNYNSSDYEGNLQSGDFLGRTLNNASYAGDEADNYYTIMFPNEDGAVLELRIDYTLVAIDGAGEEIHIYGAKAFVPAIYTQWKPNYAYTYVFKISDNTNGWTNPNENDPSGLYPITFNAVVVDSEEYTQSTITTVATPSITTYQLGHDVTKNEYEASKGNIYVMVTDDGTPKTDIGSKGIVYTLGKESDSKAEYSEANVMDALNIQKTEDTGTITGYNGLILTPIDLYYANTIPGVDGNDLIEGTDYPQYSAVRFAPESGKIYAFCYKVSTGTPKDVLIAETLTSEPGDWSGGVWFTDAAGLSPAPATFEKGNYYKKRYSNKNDVWGVKVIKVQ
jgi:hypothetical protein